MRAGKVDGRTTEIQRFIGRSLRAIVDLEARGGERLLVDCDVIQADGGTRTASITGALIAVMDAIDSIRKLLPDPKKYPLRDSVAAHERGDCRRQANARPRLPARCRGRCRHEHCDDGQKEVRRSPGNWRRGDVRLRETHWTN